MMLGKGPPVPDLEATPTAWSRDGGCSTNVQYRSSFLCTCKEAVTAWEALSCYRRAATADARVPAGKNRSSRPARRASVLTAPSPRWVSPPPTQLTLRRDEQQAFARCLIAPAWFPHPCKGSSGELTAPFHSRAGSPEPRAGAAATASSPAPAAAGRATGRARRRVNDTRPRRFCR